MRKRIRQIARGKFEYEKPSLSLPDEELNIQVIEGQEYAGNFTITSTNHVPVRIFLIDNEGYHSIRQTQKNFFGGRPVGIGPESGDLGFPDMALIARAFGYHYAECLTNDTMDETLAAVYAASVPLICRVAVTKQQTTMPKAASRRLEDGSMVSSPLEDMAPFLSREELRDNMMIPLTEAEMKA